MYKHQTTDDFSRVGVTGTRGIHCKSVTRICICRRKEIVDRESRSRTMPLRNTSTDCPTCTAVPVDFDFRLPRSLHPDVILSLTEFDRDM